MFYINFIKNKNKFSFGFTLIELLVVISIIGFLATFAAVSMRGVIEKAKITKGLQYSQSVHNSLGAEAVGVWNFDKGSGTTAFDSSGSGHDGNIQGAIYTTDTPHDIVGQGGGRYALRFNGINDYVNVGNIGVLSNNTFSISVWIKNFNPAPRQEIVWGAISGSGDKRIILEVYNSGINFHDDYGMDTWTSPKTIEANKWYNVVVTYNYPKQKASIYINGKHEASDTFFSQSPTNSLGILRIGHGPPGWWAYYFNGIIDEVRIYEQALTSTQIRKDYVESVNRHKVAINN